MGAPVAGGTDPAGSNAVGTAHPGRPIALSAMRPSTSASEGDTDCALIGTNCWAGGIATHWKTKGKRSKIHLTPVCVELVSLKIKLYPNGAHVQNGSHHHLCIKESIFCFSDQSPGRLICLRKMAM
jgi:hypothetical protein